MHVNSISKISIFKSKIIQLQNNSNFLDLMNCDDKSIKLIDQSNHKKINVNDMFEKFPEFVLT